MPSSSGIRRSTGWRSRSSTRPSPSPTSRTTSPSGFRFPERADDRQHPGADGRRPPRRLSRATASSTRASSGPTKGGIRYDTGGHARRVRRARDVDDVEVLAPAASVRRRERRRALRPALALAGRARAADAPLHLGAPADHRPPGGHPRAGHGDERADDGVDDGHLLDAARLRGPGDRHRQADLDRRLRLPARGDGRRASSWSSPRVRPARVAARGAALRRPGLRQRRLGSRRYELHELRRDRSSASPTSRAGIHRRSGLDIPALQAYAREHGSLEGCDAGRRITNEELLELECDILVLAAREDQITAENASRAARG